MGCCLLIPLGLLQGEKKKNQTKKTTLKAAACKKIFSSQSSVGTGKMRRAGWTPSSPVFDTICVSLCRDRARNRLPPFVPHRCWLPPSWPRQRWTAPIPSPGEGSPTAAPPPPTRQGVKAGARNSVVMGQEGPYVTFLYSCSVIFPSWSESYIWKRTGRDERSMAGSGQPLPTIPTLPWPWALGEPHI